MKIKRFAYHDKYRNWKLEPIDFDNLDLVLLVGVSGVGKTKILEAIANLKRIASGISYNGIQWDITFEAENGNEYRWCGEFEIQENNTTYMLSEENEQRLFSGVEYKILDEFIYVQQELILERHLHKIIAPTIDNSVSFPVARSLLSLSFLKKEAIQQVEMEIKKIVTQGSSQSILSKPFLYSYKIIDLYVGNPQVFARTKNIFMEIFPQIEDIKIEELKDFKSINVDKNHTLQFKERGNKKWIFIDSLSSGMLKVLSYVTELCLVAEHSTILIDEFENSLGVNCLSPIIEELSIANENLQFILTSHHPYIINNIDMKSWRIVTRRGGVVTVKNAKDLGLGRSKHDAFMQLINSDEYAEGIEMEEFESA